MENINVHHEIVPRVSVLIPAYNAAPYLRAAIDSVLAQTFTDFELIIVDDASTDDTPMILNSYNDPRIRINRFIHNRGVSQARNAGLMMAKGEYVALMDADDISKPERLQKQVLFLDKHVDIVSVGSLAEFIDENGRVLFRDTPDKPITPEEVASVLSWGCCFTTPSMMLRLKPVMELGGYNGSDVAEDYDLILRLAENHRLANLVEYLYAYRIHSSQASFTKIRKMRLVTDITKLHSFQRRVACGQLPANAKPFIPGFLDKLHGRRYTLASDYMSWAGTYSALNNQSIAFRLSCRALISAPLCSGCYRMAFVSLGYLVLSRRIRSVIAWYARKLLRRR